MANLILKQAKGFSKEEAASLVNFTIPVVYDATVAYNNAKDNVGFSLKEFAKSYLDAKVKGVAGAGVVIRLESAVKNTRTQPYDVTNFPTVGKTQYKKWYTLFSGSTILDKREFKSQAESLMKELITQGVAEHIDIHKVKFPVNEGPTMTGVYTPSVGTKEGSFVFFAYEA